MQDSMFVSEAQPRHSQGMTSDENARLREYLSKYIYIYLCTVCLELRNWYRDDD